MIRVFAVGSPRSGTTLLQRLLAERAGLATLPETHLVARVHSPAPLLRRAGLARRGAVAAAGEAIGRPLGPVGPWARHRTVGVVAAAAVALDAMAAERGAPGWVEKTPRHLRQIPVLTAACHPRFVHIVRAGAAVTASVVAVTGEHPDRWSGARTPIEAARRWAADVDEHRRWADHPDHAFVRYEDLAADPDTWAGALAGWLRVSGPARTVGRDEIATPEQTWIHDAAGSVAGTATADRVAAVAALEDDAEVGPVLAAATAVAATLPYERLLSAGEG